MHLLLEKQLENGTLSHAYLFKGQAGSGKKAAAQEFAQKLLETTALSNHADFTTLGIEEKASVEQVRELIARLSVKPFRAAYTVAIIENAHLLNASASNALLKQLEEPSPTSIIILVASGPVLSTIASRCQTIIFNRLGAPDFPVEVNKRASELNELQSAGVAEKLATLKTIAEIETPELTEIFSAWLQQVKSQLAQKPEKFRLVRAILTAQRQLGTNMNKKFILQELFLG